jgi:serine-type D-Ala-D-Ala carboxypeptidase (penicillin-binding protein 5/6)
MWHGFKLGIFVLIITTVLFYGRGDFSSANKAVLVTNPSYVVASSTIDTEATYLIFDAETGEVIAENNANAVLPIASITKLFTATALLKTDLSASTTINQNDVAAPAPFGKLQSGEEYKMRELLFPLLLESSNDVAAHFERVTKGEVINLMNSLATEAGLKKTVLADASGLSSLNVSTASDLAHFLSYLYKNEPHILDITRLEQYVGPYTGWVNNSPVLDKDYLGGKHGYTEEAMRTGAVLFKEEISGTEKTIGYIVLGGDDLAETVKELRGFVHTHVRFE